MARKPNYDFDRKERERLKNLKKAAREDAKIKPPVDDVPAGVPGKASTEE